MGQLRSETRAIDGLNVTTTQLPAMRGFALLPRLGKVIAPALAQVGDSFDALLAADVSVILPALGTLFAQLEEGEATALARELLSSTVVEIDGRRVLLDRDEAIDLVFSGKLRTMIQVLRFSLEINYADFSVGAPGTEASAGAPLPNVASRSDSTTISHPRGHAGASG